MPPFATGTQGESRPSQHVTASPGFILRWARCSSEGRLDVIHVLLPPELHAQTAAEIIDAGLHVLLEKPMAIAAEACTNLIERARSKGVKIGVGHNFLFAPIYETSEA